MSREEYERLDAHVRGEYIDGALVMSPSASRRHQRICLDLAVRLRAVHYWIVDPRDRVLLAYDLVDGEYGTVAQIETTGTVAFAGTELAVDLDSLLGEPGPDTPM